MGWEQQNGVMVRFAEEGAREGFVCIEEVSNNPECYQLDML
jgi:hypothetical protein